MLVLIAGCTADPSGTPPALEELELPGGDRFTLHPPVVGQDTEVRLELDSLRSALSFDGTSLALEADGLVLESFAVLDGFTATAELRIEADAPLGPVDAILTVGSDVHTLDDALTIVDQRFTLEPEQARMGEVVDLELEAVNTDWMEGETWVRVGEGVQTLAVDVTGPTTLQARVAIASDARPGPRDVIVEQAGRALTRFDGFQVDREVITATFDPPVVEQGQEVDVVIEAVNTRFPEGFTSDRVRFWRQTSEVADFSWLDFEVVATDRIEGRLKVSNAAVPGFADVFIDDAADLLVQDALEVLPVAPDPLDAILVKGFDVRRTLHADGTASDVVSAFAWFQIPLDPPCGPPWIPPLGPVPFDIEGVFPIIEQAERPDCPDPLTIDAGAHMYFESPSNVVTLHRETVGSSGRTIYRGRDLGLSDYQFGQTYAIRADGASGGIPAFTIPDAQPTVPRDVQITSPVAGTTVSRFDPLPLAWTEAGVYPTGLFTLSVRGLDAVSAEPAMAAMIPFDDGTTSFSPATLGQLAAGSATFRAVSAVEGRIWQLPLNGRNHQGDSTLVISAPLTLQ